MVAPLRLQDWSKMNSTFRAITGYYMQDASELSGELPEKVRQALVTPHFLQVWGIAPVLGRDFAPNEERFGGPNAILISDSYWRRRFAADPGVIGKQLRLDGWSYQIIGVMPASFLFLDRNVDLWSPSPMDAPFAQHRQIGWFKVIGHLKPGITVEQAQADMSTLQANLARQYPKTDADVKAVVLPLKETTVGGVSRSLWILFGSVSVLLLIACTNIAALLLSRAAQRQHEISVRFSLGAGRRSVIGQLLAECFLLAAAGASLGLFIAAGASSIFRSLAANLPRIDEIGLDWRIMLYSLACAVTATFLCGLYPAIRSTRGDMVSSLMQGSRTQVSSHGFANLALVGIQVSLAVALLICAGLLTRSFRELGRVSPGFDPAHVLAFRISANWGETGNQNALKQKTRRIIDHLRAVPGVSEAAMAMAIPGAPARYQLELKADGRTESESKITAEIRYVSPEYFSTLRIPLIAGKLCGDSADTSGVMVNRSFANTYFTGLDVIGRRLQQISLPQGGEIRGIVGDAREMGIDRAPAPTVYWCYVQAQPGAIFLARTQADPAAMAETIRRKIREIEPTRSVFDIAPLEERISDAFAENRLRTFLLAFFAATAVMLACVGLYGTLSYMVNVRRREIGLRLALGALRGQIASLFLAQGIGVSVIGCVVGLCLAAGFTRLLAGMLYGVSPSDAITFIGVIVMMLGVAIAASLLPAIRAARLDPMQVLRDE